MDTKQVLFSLCAAAGPAGAEGEAADLAAKELGQYAQVRTDALGNVIGEIVPERYTRHVLLDAHIDEIGMIVTHLEDGFVRVDKTGRGGPADFTRPGGYHLGQGAGGRNLLRGAPASEQGRGAQKGPGPGGRLD